ncbi:purple acid phosphatase 3-like [Olea europaea subsp. europaea]|uniref:Purple acid phosphatase 3-like n=1 Tax=Olea europaea subsp. europaea TaxID=158383 RepID=A0A8S0RIW0_OLEEU|nr:purple acid phosphatase 3-like [Olea europaea subsp. europaea]
MPDLISRDATIVRSALSGDKIDHKAATEAIKSETSERFKFALSTILSCDENPGKYFAKVLHKAMKDMGTDDTTLTRVIVTQAEIDMQDIKAEYEKKHEKSLIDPVHSETSSHYRAFLLSLLGSQFDDIGTRHIYSPPDLFSPLNVEDLEFFFLEEVMDQVLMGLSWAFSARKLPSYLSIFSLGVLHPPSGTVHPTEPTNPNPIDPMAIKNDLFIFICVIVRTIFIIGGNTELQSFEHLTKVNGSLSILVVRNWGRKGSYNQSHVVYQMGIIGGEDGPSFFIISTGDNFYHNGLIDEHDTTLRIHLPKFTLHPACRYSGILFWGTMTTGDGLTQLSPILKQRNSKWFCLKSYILSTDIAKFFFINTTPFQGKYFTDPKDEVYDWRGMLPRENYLTILLKDLESALRESHAKWKIVVGHHTIRSGGIHGDSEELVKRLLPILQAYIADIYINGPDHCLEQVSSGDM